MGNNEPIGQQSGVTTNNLEGMLKDTCTPIYYGEKEKVVILELIIEMIKCIDDNEREKKFINYQSKLMLLSLFTKDESYCAEKEWRFLLTNKDASFNQKVFFPYATSIYLGNSLDSEKRKNLIDIARTKGLNVYSRVLCVGNSKWKYVKEEI